MSLISQADFGFERAEKRSKRRFESLGTSPEDNSRNRDCTFRSEIRVWRRVNDRRDRPSSLRRDRR